MNRKCEFLLGEVEFLSSVALFAGADQNFQYPSVELARLWKLLLLNQFHDVLPGSSITLVSGWVSNQVRHKLACIVIEV